MYFMVNKSRVTHYIGYRISNLPEKETTEAPDGTQIHTRGPNYKCSTLYYYYFLIHKFESLYSIYQHKFQINELLYNVSSVTPTI